MSSEVTESAGFYEFLAWLEINKKRIVVTTSVIAAVAVAFSFLVWRSKQKEIEASAALFQLGLPLQMGENTPPIPASEYFNMATSHQGTQASMMAELLGAGSLFNDGKYAEALEQFKKFQAAHPGGIMTAIAGIGAASSLESLGKFDEALQAYQALVSSYPNEPVSVQAKVAMGRLYENKKQPEQAFKAYEEVIHQQQRTSWQRDAGNRREQLLVQFPYLAPTNAPPVVTSSMKPNQLVSTNKQLQSNSLPLTATNSSAAKTNPLPAGAK